MIHTRGIGVESNGALIHTQVYGDTKGRPLVFLHGGLGTLEDFTPLIEAFADYHCVLMDTRGHGASTLTQQPLSYPLLAEDVEHVIAAHDLKRPAVIGHSDGGITGVHVAIRQNCELSGLVAIATHGDAPRTDIMNTIYANLSSKRWRERFPDGVALYERLNPNPDFERLFEVVVAMWRNVTDGNYPGRETSRIQCPALIMGGDVDHLVPRDETIALAQAISKASLGIAPSGSHIFHQEHPDLVIPYIRQFLAGAP